MPGKVRASPAGNQQIQPRLHRGHDVGVYQVPRDGGDQVTLLQECAIFDTQVFEHLGGSELTADLQGVPPHREQCRPPEGSEVVVEQSRCQYGYELADVRGKLAVVVLYIYALSHADSNVLRCLF